MGHITRHALIALAGYLLAAPALPRATTDSGEIDEVLVTANRYARDLSAYGGSAQRLTRDEIAARAANHYADLLTGVPGVYLQRGSGQEGLIAIRSPVLTGPGACGAFLLLEDGLPLRPVGFCNVNELFETNTEQAEAIEVLRG
ncbi:MAG: TonB-dependent receptor plug domain-containing protein, partial [Steroidobacteraceae bacterium]|nr:TonB-dependent receptor plug domain-containing protein [Steroidobacteraceae bacterium]